MNKTGIPYLDYCINPVIMRCSFTGCPTRDTCWHLGFCKRMANNPKIPLRYQEIYLGKRPPVLDQERLEQTLKIRNPSRIGIQFMGDLFDEQVKQKWVDEIFFVIKPTSQHQYFILTKQVTRMAQWRFDTDILGGGDWYRNIFFGITVTSQTDADRMIPDLLRIPGKHWLSIEPLMEGPIDLSEWLFMDGIGILDFINFCVVGCHNHPSKYPCELSWIEDIVRQCRAAGVPCYVKQIPIGGKVCRDISKFPATVAVREWPK